MILFTILLCAILIVAAVVLITAIVTGGSMLIIFGDLFVFCGIMYLLMRLFTKKK